MADMPPRSLASRLYAFNTAPGVTQCVDPGKLHLNEALCGAYELTADDHWLRCTSPRLKRILRHKLYVSPATDRLPETFAEVAEVCRTHKVLAFKVGLGVRGAARSDKLVLYFDNREHLADCAETLNARTLSDQGQGVPFTAGFGASLILSWACDPVDAGHSWRSLIASLLARSLAKDRWMPLSARIASAKQALRDESIDPDAWTPIGATL
jgi:hypothetical protein